MTRGSAELDRLGTRPIGRLLWWTCSQTTLSVGVYGIYALTNAWFVARGVGETALAAVNLVAPVLLILGAVSTTVGVGGASLVSRSLGAGRPEEAARAAGTAFALFWLVAVAVTVAGLLALDPLMALLGASGPTIGYARPYAAVIIAGSIFSTGFSAVVRAEGQLLFSTMLWGIPVLVQIVLDPLLIFGFGMGVTGAALGTVGGQAVSAGMAVWFFFLKRDRPYRIRRADLRLNLTTIGAVLAVGAPSFLAGLGATLLAVLVNTSLAGAGAVALAAYAVCARIQTFVFMPQLGITQGIQPIVGYNAGRGLTRRVGRTRTLALRATVGYGALTAVLVAVFAEPIVRLFVGDPPTVAVAAGALRIMAIGYVFAGVPPLISAYFQALGRALPSYLISIGVPALIKAPIVLALGQFGRLGPMGIWIALPAGEVVSVVAAAGLLWAVTARRPRASR
ncbi:putative efflux protein, MATE family [Nonomuraea solani]|uniref:Multidrug export protein MepA n=1 Tax=Nonomuraea solani TaxID=1144553 RepID=A0A1H6EZ31_9ACTN|nr:MATE family efflux transporter [Nonomuraea solani]SEH03150.1 putative efflux protein, MATE family [Nonomuraea solani]